MIVICNGEVLTVWPHYLSVLLGTAVHVPKNDTFHNELKGGKKVQFQMCVSDSVVAQLPQRIKSTFFKKKFSTRESLEKHWF